MKNKVFIILKGLVASWIVGGLLLIIFSWGMYNFSLSDGYLKTFVGIIYFLTALVAGKSIGGAIGNKRFMWGIVGGLSFFLSIYIVSLCFSGKPMGFSLETLKSIGFCAVGGMMGGMISKPSNFK